MIDDKEQARRQAENLQVTFTFADADTLDAFVGWMCDGGGEQEASESYDGDLAFDYSRCFGGHDTTKPRHVDVTEYSD